MLKTSVLRGAARVFRAGVWIKNTLYQHRFLKPYHAPSFVVSIGSIKAGGTGKTPLVLHLLETLSNESVGVVTRGYRGKFEKGQVACKGTPFPPSFMGDEPYLIGKRFPQVPLYIGKDRVLSAKKAKEEILILDDGMQHRRLFRNLEIVTLQGGDLFGGDAYLPQGYLRDAPCRLKDADYVIVEAFQESVLERIRRYTKAPVIGVEKRILFFSNLRGEKVDPPKKGVLFCALGYPPSFISLIEKAGIEIERVMTKRDHDLFSEKELALFETLICTEKDAVKLESFLPTCIYPVITLDVSYGKEAWQAMIKTIKRKGKEA